jgi:glutamate/aspartate transport system permease protein
MSSYHWDWAVLIRQPYLMWLGQGLLTTVCLAIGGWIIALPVGTLIGVLRVVPSRALRLVAGLYVNVFRNIPLLAQLFLWFFVLPELVPDAMGHFLKRDLPYPEFAMATIGLGFYTSARIAETVKSGLASIGPGNLNAALATGMTHGQAYRHVLLPLAFRLIVPPLTSEFLGIFKASSVALTIGVLELTMQAHQIESYTFNGFEAFTAATVIYALISWLCLIVANTVARRSSVVGMIGREGDSP